MLPALFLFFYLFVVPAPTAGIGLETIKHCCNLGTKWANSGKACSQYDLTDQGILQQYMKHCLHTADVCCRKEFRNVQCSLGKTDAKSGNCLSEQNERQDCCTACLLGIDSGKAGEICDDSLGEPFHSCCEESRANSSTVQPTTPRPTTLMHSSKIQPDDYYPMPSMESLCDSGEMCAQICVPSDNSFKCGCYKGYTLMADGVSCKPEKRALTKGGRCQDHNPCDHDCIDTGTAIQCLCREGYELAKDKKSCNDIDECARKLHNCHANEECVNEIGTYYCEDPNDPIEPESDVSRSCPPGFQINGEGMLCNDIDECQFGIVCPKPQICKNTIGSFICEGSAAPQCPPGFKFKDAIQDCADVDECITGENDCNKESQVCLNTKGNYTCVDKASKTNCPPGFKKNTFTNACEDINECIEIEDLCKPGEICVNEPGGHSCELSKNGVPATATKFSTTTEKPILFFKPTTIKTNQFLPNTTASCPLGFRYSGYGCVDVNECEEDPETCDKYQTCYNTPGSYTCNCKIGFQKDYHTGACVDINECQAKTHDCTVAQRCDNTIGSYLCSRITGCGTGYTLNYASGLCEDDDECALGTHNCNQLGPNYKCKNLLGSYRCELIRQTSKIPVYASSPRVTVTPFRITTPFAISTVYRTKPSSFYQYTTQVQQVYPTAAQTPLKSFNIYHKPPTVIKNPFNTFTSPTNSYGNYPIISGQLKKCLPGYRMNSRGECEDVNECESNPCPKGQKCHNYNGKYHCSSPLICAKGMEPNESGDKCIDVNECSRGTHTCNESQICKNGEGYHTCECPPGHHIVRSTDYCEDMDECKLYRPCGVNANCINTKGSYLCKCKEGYVKQFNNCKDINECEEAPGLCDHICVNTWGSYRCACRAGFTLSHDNRTCIDVDECEKFKDTKLCIGSCQNVPGSYTCTCPKGYKLGNDGRVCLDIDECEKNPCGRNDLCINLRGGYKCYQIDCPPNYKRDPEHRSRCIRHVNHCDLRDNECLNQPLQYTYQYTTLVSDLPLSDGHITIYKIKGPQWSSAKAKFITNLEKVTCPYHVRKFDESYYRIIQDDYNTLEVNLIKPIQGPQEITIKIEMQLFDSNTFYNRYVIFANIIVSEYPF